MACPLFTGKLSGFTITCPCHDWRFDVRTGKFLDAPELGIAVFPVKSEAGKVFVKIQ
jgi:3-phenylpropionate/trans-cinnamate dioxygenase ferredoxin subunit